VRLHAALTSLRHRGSLSLRPRFISRYLSGAVTPGPLPLISLATIGTKIMSTFDRRTEAFEKKFALDEERRFKAEVRRNRLLGFWAAERLGITGDAAATYANEVVAADLEEAGDADVVRKIMGDLAAKDAAVTEQAIRAKMNDFTAQALAEVKAGK